MQVSWSGWPAIDGQGGSISSGDTTGVGSTSTSASIPPATHTYTVTATDSAGNTDSAEITVASPALLEVYDYSNQTRITWNQTFSTYYTSLGTFSRSSNTGRMSFDGLPREGMTFDADATGYKERQGLYMADIITNQSVFLFRDVGDDGTIQGGPEPPIACFTADPVSPETNTTVVFDASCSERAASYRWGEKAAVGGIDTDPPDGTGKTITANYSENGTKTILLSVSNSQGADAMVRTIYVRNPNGGVLYPPNATWTYSPQSPDVGETVSFNATNDSSTDADGHVDSFEWDLDGDGDYDDATGEDVTFTYNSPQYVVASLNATDNDGLSNVTSKLIRVGGGPQNRIVNVSFTLNDQTNNYPPQGTTLYIETGSGSGWQIYESGRFGSDNQVATDLLENTTYRLRIANDEGDERVLQQYSPPFGKDSDIVELTVYSLGVGTPEPGTLYEWNATLDAQAQTIRYTFRGPEDKTTDLELDIYERGNESNSPDLVSLPQTYAGPHGNLTITVPLVANSTLNETNTTWVVEWEATRDGETITGQKVLNKPTITNPIPGLPDWVQEWVSIGLIITTGLLFGRHNAALGAITVSLLAGALFLAGWMQGMITGIGIAVAISVAVGWRMISQNNARF